MTDTRSPEEIAAGNRRALLGCGLILLVCGVVCGGGYWSIRGVFGDGAGEVCDEAMDCQWGHECVRLGGAAESQCAVSCDSDADCDSGRCLEATVPGQTVITSHDVCAP